jgi:hypothetical protein
MRYFYIIVASFALSMTLAVSAMTLASTASSQPTYALTEWLRGGVPVTTDLLSADTGELLLEDLESSAAGGLKVAVTCSLSMDGFTGENGFDEVTELLNSGNASINVTPLAGTSLSCTRENLCESSKVWAVNLPWQTGFKEWREGANKGFVDLYLPGGSGLPIGWYIECIIIGVKSTDECTTPEAVVEFGAGESKISEAITLLFGAKLASCTASAGKEVGVIEGTTFGSFAEGGMLE